jgi:hypothetical protein
MYRVKGKLIQARALDTFLALVSYIHNHPTRHRVSTCSGRERVYQPEGTHSDLFDLNLGQRHDAKASCASIYLKDLPEADTSRDQITLRSFWLLIEFIPENDFSYNGHVVSQCPALFLLFGTPFSEKHHIVRIFTLVIAVGFNFFEAHLNHVLAGSRCKACLFFIHTLRSDSYIERMHIFVFAACSNTVFKVS